MLLRRSNMRRVLVTESQLRAIEEMLLNEAAAALEYHYTSLRNFCSIMRTGGLKLMNSCTEVGRMGHFVSLTRMRNSSEGYGRNMMTRFLLGDGPVVRIEFDGRKLGNLRNVDIRPYDYFYNNYTRDDWDEDGGLDEDTRGRHEINTAEAEDSLTLRDGGTFLGGIVPTVNRVDILLPERMEEMQVWELFLNMYDSPEYKEWVNKIYFFDNKANFDYQRGEISFASVLRKYGEQMKQYNMMISEDINNMGKKFIKLNEAQLRKFIMEAINGEKEKSSNEKSYYGDNDGWDYDGGEWDTNLKKVVKESVDKVLKEAHLDYLSSGSMEYQGTGSPESKERVKKIRDKANDYPKFKPGRNLRNKTSFEIAQRQYGGENAKEGSEILKPIKDYLKTLEKYCDKNEAIADLYDSIDQALWEWRQKYENWYKQNYNGDFSHPNARKKK